MEWPNGGALGQVSDRDRDSQHHPLIRNATRVQKKGGGGSTVYILPNFDEK